MCICLVFRLASVAGPIPGILRTGSGSTFLGFILGIVSYAWLTAYFFKQPVTSKIFVQLILCFLIVLVQVLWKEKVQ